MADIQGYDVGPNAPAPPELFQALLPETSQAPFSGTLNVSLKEYTLNHISKIYDLSNSPPLPHLFRVSTLQAQTTA